MRVAAIFILDVVVKARFELLILTDERVVRLFEQVEIGLQLFLSTKHSLLL